MELPGSGWEPVTVGESATEVFRRGDVFAKLCVAAGVPELRDERDRVEWLAGTGLPGAEVVDWVESFDGACLLTTALPGVAAADLPWSRPLSDSLAGVIRSLHEFPPEKCPFERRLRDVVSQAEDVVRRGAVNPDFLTDEWRRVRPEDLLARIHAELAEVPAADLVVCHGDACLPNVLFDPDTLECTGLIDLGRLGIADRHSDLALLQAQLDELHPGAAPTFFTTYGPTDPTRLAFYHLLDPLTWG
ncbi:streptomycin 3'-kinase [Kribbella orskensis]|uniref:Streptomycin 3'-kinase n=1 Tax=Kribbella orskensis TaxID=2512216 RepID=A0ABY2C0F9_9ACTN|nr:aminoglycoside 3'-phosphotransferase [Kribbella orskensis]TCO32328.1 streptomycin 3'-kinase [Kribbella orskensis]